MNLKKLTKSQIVIISAVALTVLCIIFCLTIGRNDSKQQGGRSRGGNTVFSVITQTVQKEVLHGYVIANGEIESQNSVNVYPDVAGKVIETNVMLGSSVKRGDIIAYVDPSAPGQYYKKSPVYAPISGSIISTPLKNGTTVSTNTTIAIVGDISNLQVTADIPERYVAVLKEGLKAEISVEAYPGVVFEATVSRVSPVVDTTSRTKEVVLHFNTRDERVNAGMFGKVKLYTQDYKDQVVMPSDALVQLNDENYAYVVKEDSTVERRKVVTGKSVDGKIQITEGISEGEKVVIQGQTSLNDGSKIRDIGNAGAKSADTENSGDEKDGAGNGAEKTGAEKNGAEKAHSKN
ncbi:MAG TPA: efflux RND transporter periplasmic adaptor subunit [Treponema sp.]|nr:efflux RND transporter periplasmic adaptor subunit [Treponema sp.]